MTGTVSNTQTNNSPKVALFDIDEVKLGEKLGSGGFSDVYAVKAFEHINTRNRKLKQAHQEARDQLINSAQDGRYAIKFLKKKLLVDSVLFDAAAQDLEFEGEALSQLDHPNILKIRGWATNGFDAYFKMNRHDAYFLLMDRLEKTLAQRIEEWKASAGSAECNSKTNKKQLLERLKIALDVASALEYLHSQGYIFRDLKPENVGLDSKGRGKLFDFGLSRKMPKDHMEGEFQMSGMIGTPRYMSPEVHQCQPYDTKADVYSFSHLLWEMLALERPYAGFTREMHKKQTVLGGSRPELDPSWPLGIQKLLARSWHSDMAKRPTMAEVRATLEIEIAGLVGSSRPRSDSCAKQMGISRTAAKRRSGRGSFASRAA